MSIVFLTRTEGSIQHYVYISWKRNETSKYLRRATCKSYINVSYTSWVWELHTSIHNVKFIRHQKHWFFVNVFTRAPATTKIIIEKEPNKGTLLDMTTGRGFCISMRELEPFNLANTASFADCINKWLRTLEIKWKRIENRSTTMLGSFDRFDCSLRRLHFS